MNSLSSKDLFKKASKNRKIEFYFPVVNLLLQIVINNETFRFTICIQQYD